MATSSFSRRADVIVRAEGDETLVLDLVTQTAHCLSGDVARVWGSTETSASAVAADTGLSAEAVESALEALRGLDLVAAPAGLSRRTLVTRGAAVGGAVVAAGAISIPLPAAAAANSTAIGTPTQQCSNGKATFSFLAGKAQFLDTTGAHGPYTVTLTYQDKSSPSRTETVTFKMNTSANKVNSVVAGSISGGTATAGPGGGSGGQFSITTGSSFGGGSITLTIAGTGPQDTFYESYSGLPPC